MVGLPLGGRLVSPFGLPGVPAGAGCPSWADVLRICEEAQMSLGFIVVILLVIFLVGGFSGRFGGYGYGFGHGGIGVIGIILLVMLVLLLTGRM